MWTLGSVLFLVLVGSSVSRTSDLIISAEPGDDVVLPCEDPNSDQDFLLEWTRADLKKDEYVFFYRDNRPYVIDQHKSFRNRVFLDNNQMKDGDLSVVLKNVTMEDSGIYECRVVEIEWKLISTIHLIVSPPPGEEGEFVGSRVRLVVLAASVLVVLVLLPVVLWISKKKTSSIQSSIKHQNPEDEDCI